MQRRPADTPADLDACWPLMRLLRPHLRGPEEFAEQVARQRRGGYRLLALWRSEEAAALAGWRIQENLLFGLHAYVDDLITRERDRSSGLGASLLTFVGEEARALGCRKLVLGTAVENVAAQRFYLRQGMRNIGMSFVKELSENSG